MRTVAPRAVATRFRVDRMGSWRVAIVLTPGILTQIFVFTQHPRRVDALLHQQLLD